MSDSNVKWNRRRLERALRSRLRLGRFYPRLTAPLWLCGFKFGIIAALVGLIRRTFYQRASGSQRLDTPELGPILPDQWFRGIGVGLIVPQVLARVPQRA